MARHAQRNFCANLLSIVRNTLEDKDFIDRHRRRPEDFTRSRKLSFSNLFLFLSGLLRSSLQNELDRFFQLLDDAGLPVRIVDRTALSHARSKLKASAFTEMNERILQRVAAEAPTRRWKGRSLRVVDGTTLRLPDSPSLREHYGEVKVNQHGTWIPARASYLADPLNHLVREARIAPVQIGERELLLQHLERLEPGDLLLADRGYAAFHVFSALRRRGVDFCFRLAVGSWPCAREFIAGGKREETIRLTPTKEMRRHCRKRNLPEKAIDLRLVRVELEGGTVEVLVTSLLDVTEVSVADLAGLYHLRWGVEEQIKWDKTRMEMENFSGKTVVAIEQDFQARIFVGNLTSALALPVHPIIEENHRGDKHRSQINWTQALAKIRALGVKL
ncbi:MAG: IS4 family transposase, partial [Verrucomicrobiales bacterium]